VRTEKHLGKCCILGIRTDSIEGTMRKIKGQNVNLQSEAHDVSHRKTKNCGHKRIEIDPNQIREVPLRKRRTIQSLAWVLNTNPTSVFRLLKKRIIRRHSNSIKPSLKEETKDLG